MSQNVVFYRSMIDDKEVIELNFPKAKIDAYIVVKQLFLELKEQNPRIAFLIDFGKVTLETEPYTIEATIKGSITVDELQLCYNNGVAGRFEFVKLHLLTKQISNHTI